jgi:hypothetical protein
MALPLRKARAADQKRSQPTRADRQGRKAADRDTVKQVIDHPLTKDTCGIRIDVLQHRLKDRRYGLTVKLHHEIVTRPRVLAKGRLRTYYRPWVVPRHVLQPPTKEEQR